MEIDFSKYNDEELMESWVSIDFDRFPDRAVDIYKLLVSRGLDAHQGESADNTFFSNLLFVFKPLLSGFLQDAVLENDLCREKEQKVLALIHSSEKNET